MINSQKKLALGIAIATCVGLIPATFIYAQSLSRPDVVAQAPPDSQALTSADIEGLKFMREEEKLFWIRDIDLVSVSCLAVRLPYALCDRFPLQSLYTCIS